MKNIHLLPTEKPSRLGYLTKKGKEVFKDLRLFDKPMPNILDSENQHIYITSDEVIKEDDWFIQLGTKGNQYPVCASYIKANKKHLGKIILTTDQDLIADGVQSIDDEFLEWFVKNPSCEFVSVQKRYSDFTVEPFIGYKIIIPQEESKQETLEEAAEKWVFETNGHKWSNNDNTAGDNYGSFKAGAKWQAEQDKKKYSEKDFKLFARQYYREIKLDKSNLLWDDLADKCLEQFKKK